MLISYQQEARGGVDAQEVKKGFYISCLRHHQKCRAISALKNPICSQYTQYGLQEIVLQEIVLGFFRK